VLTVVLPGMKRLSIIIPSGGVSRGRFVGTGGLRRRASYITAFRNGIVEVEKLEISSGDLYFERISDESRVQYFGSARRK